MINLKEKPSLVAEFVEKENYSPSVLLDTKGDVARKFHVMGIPVSFLIDKAGQIVFRSNGAVDWNSEKMQSLINTLLEESGDTI